MIGITIAFIASMVGIVAYLISAWRFDRRCDRENAERQVIAEAERIVAIARIKGPGA